MLSRKEWRKLSAYEQWQWALETDEDIVIVLDNDVTYVELAEGVPEDRLEFRTSIGNAWGLHDLFEALEISVRDI